MTIESSPQNQAGNDLYREIILPNTIVPFRVTYWDLWLTIILITQFSGDWESMIEDTRQQAKSDLWKRDRGEGLLNHLRNLRRSLENAGLSPEDILKDATPAFLKKQKPRARRKVIDMEFKEQDESYWMIETPRKQCEERALRGYWESFSVSPLHFATDLTAICESGPYYLEKQTFKLERKLSAFLDKHEARLDLTGQLALYRAFLTVLLENMDGVDDSYGVVGDLYENVFNGYYQLDRSLFGLPAEIFFQDLLELLVWEDHGFTYLKQPDFFARLSGPEVPIVEAILHQEWQELGKLELDYQSEKALTMLGLLYAQQKMFEAFVPIAQAMGTQHWQRITLLAEVAEKQQHHDLALEVYETCLKQPGMHEDYLRKEYEKLKRRIQPAAS